MPELIETDDARIVEARGLRLAFRWEGDRWTHALERRSSGDWSTIAWSLESDPAGADPARLLSPAYQQVHAQQSGDRVELLLVGQSGPHHVSAVFAVADGPDGPSVAVEVADRCRDAIEALGSTYVVGRPAVDLVEADPTRLAWRAGDDASAIVRLSIVGPGRLDVHEAGRASTHAQASALVEPGRMTHPWAYRWELLGP